MEEQKTFKKIKINRKDYLGMKILATILRIIATPILIPYRLYLWVWDGSMFHKEL